MSAVIRQLILIPSGERDPLLIGKTSTSFYHSSMISGVLTFEAVASWCSALMFHCFFDEIKIFESCQLEYIFMNVDFSYLLLKKVP